MKFIDIFEKIMKTLFVITFVMFLIGLVINIVSNMFIWWLILPIFGYLCIHIISWIIINLILNAIWGLDVKFFINDEN
jgi:hypothetical protein